MDVNVMQNASQLNRFAVQNQNARAAYSAYSANSQNAAQATSANVGNAYEVELSDAAKDAQAAQSTAAVANEETTETVKTKGLSEDAIQSLKDSIKVQEQTMLNIMMQAMSDSGVNIEGLNFSYPEIATNPEDAQKAVSEGGEWSVDAVATRLFDLATAIAGDDPEKLQEMRSAVEEGFAQAGQVWQNETGSSQMPDITQRTYNELMHRFDAHMQELTGAAAMTGA